MERETDDVSGDLGASPEPPSTAAPGPDFHRLQVRLTFVLDFEHVEGLDIDVVKLLDKLAKRCHQVVAQRRLWPLGKAVRLTKVGVVVDLVPTQAPAPDGGDDALAG